MVKYYYTDPLKAAWMAREFNISIYDCDVEELSCNLIALLAARYSIAPDKLYIHPDCHELLKPQVGDKDEDGYIWMPKRNQWVNPLIVVNWEEGKSLEHIRQESIIAKRNGKVFFMPETER